MLKFAAFQILSSVLVPQDANRDARRKIAHRHAFKYTPRPGYLYVRSRAISSRCNDNFDEFPADEIEKSYRTFVGKPVFVNHHNEDHRRARGVIIDAALHRDTLPSGGPDTWVEVLMEVDALSFPRLAQAIVARDVERTSMGCDVEYSICSICGNKATSPAEYCQHIPRMKGQRIYRSDHKTGKKEGVLVREICYGLKFFENSLLVEDPADPTAFFTGVDDSGLKMAASKRVVRHDDRTYGVADDDDPDFYEGPLFSYNDARLVRGHLNGKHEGRPHPRCGYCKDQQKTASGPFAELEWGDPDSRQPGHSHGAEQAWQSGGTHPDLCQGCGYQYANQYGKVCPTCQDQIIGMDGDAYDNYHAKWLHSLPITDERRTVPWEKAPNHTWAEGNAYPKDSNTPSRHRIPWYEPYDAITDRGPEHKPAMETMRPSLSSMAAHFAASPAEGTPIEPEKVYPHVQYIYDQATLMGHEPHFEAHQFGINAMCAHCFNSTLLDHDGKDFRLTGNIHTQPCSFNPKSPAFVDQQGPYQDQRTPYDHSKTHGFAPDDYVKRSLNSLQTMAGEFSIPLGDDDRELLQHWRDQALLDQEMHQHNERREVDLSNPQDVRAHMIEVHGMEPGDFWRNTHPEGHEALDLSTDEDRPLRPHEIRALHQHDHEHEPADYPGVIVGDNHFHHASKTAASRPAYENPGDHPTYQTMDLSPKHIVEHWDQATDDEKESGSRWYSDAHEIAKRLGNGDTAKAAGVISAYSPRANWPLNLFNAARSLIDGKAVTKGAGVMSMHHKPAQRMLDGEHYSTALNGPKTQDFAHLIAHGGDVPGEKPRVVVDRHAISVAAGRRLRDDDREQSGVDKVLGSRHYYEHAAQMYRDAATTISHKEKREVPPHVVQATTWLVRIRLNEEESEAAGGDRRLDRGRATHQQNARRRLHELVRQHNLDHGDNMHLTNPDEKTAGLSTMASMFVVAHGDHTEPDVGPAFDGEEGSMLHAHRDGSTMMPGLGCPHCKAGFFDADARSSHIKEHHPGEYSGPSEDMQAIQDIIDQRKAESEAAERGEYGFAPSIKHDDLHALQHHIHNHDGHSPGMYEGESEGFSYEDSYDASRIREMHDAAHREMDEENPEGRHGKGEWGFHWHANPEWGEEYDYRRHVTGVPTYKKADPHYDLGPAMRTHMQRAHGWEQYDTDSSFDLARAHQNVHEAYDPDDDRDEPPNHKHGSLSAMASLFVVAELSDDEIQRGLNLPEAGKPVNRGEELGQHLWNGIVKAMGFEDEDEMRLHNHNQQMVDLKNRYGDHPGGRYGWDDRDDEGDENGEPYYEVKHHPSGFTARDYGGANVHIYHEATPDQAHDLIDAHDTTAPETSTGYRDSMGSLGKPGWKHPQYGHDALTQELHHWVGEYGKDYTRNDRRIQRWQQRHGSKTAHGGSNDAYVHCDRGHRHWGAGGAAGLLLRHRGENGETRYMLQKRGPEVDHPNTVSIPGGAIGPGEHPVDAATREAQEEMRDLPNFRVSHVHVNDHGGWQYHTVVADVDHRFDPEGDGDEHGGAGWHTKDEIDSMDLHPGFAESWGEVRQGL